MRLPLVVGLRDSSFFFLDAGDIRFVNILADNGTGAAALEVYLFHKFR